MPSRALLACALLATAFAARTYKLFDSSVWGDDVWSVAAASGHSLDVRFEGMLPGETYHDPEGPAPAASYLRYLQPLPGNNLWRVARDSFAQESHPPLYFLMLCEWMNVFGFSLASGRAFSLLFGMITLPVLFFFTRRIVNETAAWIACVLCAFAPFQSQLAILIRAYTLTALLVMITSWLTLEILERGPEQKLLRALMWLGIAGMMLHYYFPLFSMLQGAALLTQRRLRRAALAIGAVWTAVLAALAYYFTASPSSLAQPWIKGPWENGLLLLNGASALTDLLILSPNESLRAFIDSPALILAIKAVMVAVVGALLVTAARALPRHRALFLLLWFFAPMAMIYVLDVARHSGTVMTTRYFAGCAFPLYILLAAGLSHWRLPARVAGAVFLLLMMIECQAALRVLPAGTVEERYDAKRPAERIAKEWRNGDLVVVASNYGCVPISIAAYLPPQTPMESLVYLPRPEAGPVVEPATLDTLVPRLNREVAGAPRLWVLESFPDPSLIRALHTWLDARYSNLGVTRYGQLRLIEYAK